MSKGTIELFTPEGEVKVYKLFSARLPEFLDKYPKSEGYRVAIETTDTLSSKPALMKLYEAAIASGKNPTDLGLPPFPAGDVVVFKASLLSKEGTVLETASSVRRIIEYKDWEKGETAARQRLVAALGFGGECFDNDERADMKQQGLLNNPTPADKPNDVPSTSKEKTALAASDPQGDEAKDAATVACAEKPDTLDVDPGETSSDAAVADDSDVSCGTDVSADVLASPSKTDSDASKEAAAPDNKEEEIPPRLIRQIEHQANLKKMDLAKIPAYKTVKEAKTVLKDLMRK